MMLIGSIPKRTIFFKDGTTWAKKSSDFDVLTAQKYAN